MCLILSSMNEVVHTSPTIGSNVEEIVVNNTHFLMWDIGGQESLRSSWNTYYTNTEVCLLNLFWQVALFLLFFFCTVYWHYSRKTFHYILVLVTVCDSCGGQHRQREDLCDQRRALQNASSWGESCIRIMVTAHHLYFPDVFIQIS